MPAFAKIAAVAAFLLLGPAMYVVSRAHMLSRAFERVQVGDSAAAVRGTMGRPQDERGGDASPAAKIEYRYSVWPFPRAWVVGVRDGKVVDKAEIER
jgi:hypothetical protein